MRSQLTDKHDAKSIITSLTPEIPIFYPHISSSPFFFEGDNINLFIPCYMKMIIKNVRQREMAKLTAVVEGQFELSINLTDVPQVLAKFIVQHIRLEFIDGQSDVLSKMPECLIIQVNKLATFSFICQTPMILTNKNPFITPFDQCQLSTTVSVSCNPYLSDGKKINIRFNFMDCQDIEEKLEIDLLIEDSEFRSSEECSKAEFTTSQFEKVTLIEADLTMEQELDRSKSFHYANYSILQYRFPGLIILAFFLPIWIFAFMNICIFFSTPKLHERVSDISTLMLFCIAFMPFLRGRLSFSPHVTLPDINLYILIFTCLLGLWESLSVRHLPQKGYLFTDIKNFRFAFSAITFLLSIFLVLVFYCIHKCHWEPKFVKKNRIVEENAKNQQSDGSTMEDEYHQQESAIYEKLDIKKWGNTQCDIYFSKYVEHILPVKYLKLQAK